MKLYHIEHNKVIIVHENKVRYSDTDYSSLLQAKNLDAQLLSLWQKGKPTKLKDHKHLPLILPNQELWACGVTYLRSKVGRQEESREAGSGDFYEKIYHAKRPEVFFKANANRIAGSNEGVRIRKDSKWNVPEPELTLVVNAKKKIIGYTIGNDMSSRSIEGENPLYLPQAKTYDGCASIGPCLSTENPFDDKDTQIKLTIMRDGVKIYSDKVLLSQMKRKAETLVDYVYKECSFPNGCLIMTGTGIVPPAGFTLHIGDEIRITISGIGELINTVIK